MDKKSKEVLAKKRKGASKGNNKGKYNITTDDIKWLKDQLKEEKQATGKEAIVFPIDDFKNAIGYSGNAKPNAFTYGINSKLEKLKSGLRCGYQNKGEEVYFYEK